MQYVWTFRILCWLFNAQNMQITQKCCAIRVLSLSLQKNPVHVSLPAFLQSSKQWCFIKIDLSRVILIGINSVKMVRNTVHMTTECCSFMNLGEEGFRCELKTETSPKIWKPSQQFLQTNTKISWDPRNPIKETNMVIM